MILRRIRVLLPGGGFRSLLALAATALLLVLVTANVVRQVRAEVMDDGVYWGMERGSVVALRVDGAGAGAGVRPGDTLQAIADDRTGAVFMVESPLDVRRVLDTTAAGGSLRYVLVREGVRRGLMLPVAPLPRQNPTLYFFLVVVGVFAGGAGAFVFAFRRGASAATHFYGFCTLWLMAFAFSFTGELDLLDHTFFWLDRIGVILFPPVFLHLALVFPYPGRFLRGRPRLLRWIYLPPVALLAVSLASRLLYFSPFGSGPMIITGSERLLGLLEPVLWALYSVAAFAAFVDSYRRAESVTVRKQLKWIVWGTGCGTLPFAVIYAIPHVMGLPTTTGMELSLIPMALAPLSFAYAIVKYRLMDVEILFKRGLFTASLMGVIAAVYLAAYFLGTRYVGADEHSLLIAVLSAIIAALVLPAFRDRAERFVDRLFYREKYDFRRALVRLASEMNSRLDLETLGERLVERIAETFRLDRVALLAASDSPAREMRVLSAHGAPGGDDAALAAVAASSEVARRLRSGRVARFTDATVAGESWMRCAVPCVSRREVVGVILLGSVWGDEDLSSEDLDLVRTVAAQAATALVNARLYGSLRRKHDEVVALREQSEDTIESLGEGVAVIGLDGRVTRWNRSMERIFGHSRHEVFGVGFDRVFARELRQSLHAGLGRDWLEQGTRGGLPRLRLRGSGGEEKVVNVKVAPFVSGSGEHNGALLIVEDITERVRMENELQLREKMNALGVLAAGIAHEVNTPLTGISSFTQMLQDQTTDRDPRRVLLNKIESQAERASRIVNGLLNFARTGPSEFGPVDLNRVLGETLALLDHQVRNARIRIRQDLYPNLPSIRGDENKLLQVFVNLVVNSFDAMPAGGWLTLVTRRDGETVTAEVADTGHGIAEEEIRRIYDPFYSTKKKAGGNGLGLSISYGIVQEHSGSMEVESQPGNGTRFVIAFPVAEAEGAVTRVEGKAGS